MQVTSFRWVPIGRSARRLSFATTAHRILYVGCADLPCDAVHVGCRMPPGGLPETPRGLREPPRGLRLRKAPGCARGAAAVEGVSSAPRAQACWARWPNRFANKTCFYKIYIYIYILLLLLLLLLKNKKTELPTRRDGRQRPRPAGRS